MIKELVEYIENFPDFRELNGYDGVDVDYLRDINSFSIEPLAGEDIIKTYTNGDRVMSYDFAFNAKFMYSEDTYQNIINSEFFERFSRWIRSNDSKSIYPKFEKCTVEKIEVTNKPTLIKVESEESIYQITVRIVYVESFNFN